MNQFGLAFLLCGIAFLLSLVLNVDVEYQILSGIGTIILGLLFLYDSDMSDIDNNWPDGYA